CARRDLERWFAYW
nr:immunoglobulin heavy chain junction region [Mus musculus]